VLMRKITQKLDHPRNSYCSLFFSGFLALNDSKLHIITASPGFKVIQPNAGWIRGGGWLFTIAVTIITWPTLYLNHDYDLTLVQARRLSPIYPVNTAYVSLRGGTGNRI
jgi:hypothetical protein